MKSFSYVITDSLGIHARPAGLLVKECSKFKSSIMIGNGSKETDAKRILGVMSLGIKQGNTVYFNVEGEDEEEAAAVIESFMKSNL